MHKHVPRGVCRKSAAVPGPGHDKPRSFPVSSKARKSSQEQSIKITKFFSVFHPGYSSPHEHHPLNGPYPLLPSRRGIAASRSSVAAPGNNSYSTCQLPENTTILTRGGQRRCLLCCLRPPFSAPVLSAVARLARPFADPEAQGHGEPQVPPNVRLRTCAPRTAFEARSSISEGGREQTGGERETIAASQHFTPLRTEISEGLPRAVEQA